MLNTLDQLTSGNAEVVRFYSIARVLWQPTVSRLLRGSPEESVDLIAAELHALRHRFEEECGGREFGQEIMVFSVFASLLPVNGERLDLEKGALAVAYLVQAFLRSSPPANAEVRSHLGKALALYDMEAIADEFGLDDWIERHAAHLTLVRKLPRST